MLDLRSQNIILICKNHFYYKENENMIPRVALKYYMSQICYGDLEHTHYYSDNLLMSIVKEVVLDFLRNAEEGHAIRLVRDYFEASERSIELDSWLVALELVQVREKNEQTGEYEFINGFFHDCVIDENGDGKTMLYPEYEAAREYTKNFDYGQTVLYENEEWQIVSFPNSMKVKIEQDLEDVWNTRTVSIFEIKQIEKDNAEDDK